VLLRRGGTLGPLPGDRFFDGKLVTRANAFALCFISQLLDSSGKLDVGQSTAGRLGCVSCAIIFRYCSSIAAWGGRFGAHLRYPGLLQPAVRRLARA